MENYRRVPWNNCVKGKFWGDAITSSEQLSTVDTGIIEAGCIKSDSHHTMWWARPIIQSFCLLFSEWFVLLIFWMLLVVPLYVPTSRSGLLVGHLRSDSFHYRRASRGMHEFSPFFVWFLKDNLFNKQPRMDFSPTQYHCTSRTSLLPSSVMIIHSSDDGLLHVRRQQEIRTETSCPAFPVTWWERFFEVIPEGKEKTVPTLFSPPTMWKGWLDRSPRMNLTEFYSSSTVQGITGRRTKEETGQERSSTHITNSKTSMPLASRLFVLFASERKLSLDWMYITCFSKRMINLNLRADEN